MSVARDQIEQEAGVGGGVMGLAGQGGGVTDFFARLLPVRDERMNKRVPPLPDGEKAENFAHPGVAAAVVFAFVGEHPAPAFLGPGLEGFGRNDDERMKAAAEAGALTVFRNTEFFWRGQG